MDYRQLGETDMLVSSLGFGASSLGSVFRQINEKEGIRTVRYALHNGINIIDVSPYYGLTKAETILGKALHGVSRETYYLSSKAGRYSDVRFDFSYTSIIDSVHKSLERLKTDYLDILFLHDIEYGDFNQVINEAIPAAQKLKEQGKIRYLGVSGLPLSIFEKTMSCTNIDVILSYCHYTLNDTSLLTILPELQKSEVGLINASPLGMGLLTTGGAPQWHPATSEIKAKCQEAANYCSSRNVDIAKLAIQFSTMNPDIPTTLVSTADIENMRKNIEWTNEPVNYELLDEVSNILLPIKNRTWKSGIEVS